MARRKKPNDTMVDEYGESLRIHTIGRYLKKEFGEKVVKLSLDGGFTCPNRDGTKGTGGCLFCSEEGGSDFASTIEEQIEVLAGKWPNAKHLAYFQNHTGTYAPIEELREKYYAALADPRIHGIVIATRPDCLDEAVLDLLEEIHKAHFLWVELGLQTMHDQTAQAINRCYPLSVFDQAMTALNQRGIPVVVHLILGLPGESREDMMATARYVASHQAWGIKLHLLNVVSNSRLGRQQPSYTPFSDMDEYIQLVCNILEELPPDMVVHRLTGDAPQKTLLAPSWSYRKRSILNGIYGELRRRDSWQGKKYPAL